MLTCASACGQTEMVRLLVRARADIDLQDRWGCSALGEICVRFKPCHAHRAVHASCQTPSVLQIHHSPPTSCLVYICGGSCPVSWGVLGAELSVYIGGRWGRAARSIGGDGWRAAPRPHVLANRRHSLPRRQPPLAASWSFSRVARSFTRGRAARPGRSKCRCQSPQPSRGGRAA